MDNKVAPIPPHLRGTLADITALCQVKSIDHLKKGGDDLPMAVCREECPGEMVYAVHRRLAFALTTCIVVMSENQADILRGDSRFTFLRSIVRTSDLAWRDESA